MIKKVRVSDYDQNLCFSCTQKIQSYSSKVSPPLILFSKQEVIKYAKKPSYFVHILAQYMNIAFNYQILIKTFIFHACTKHNHIYLSLLVPLKLSLKTGSIRVCWNPLFFVHMIAQNLIIAFNLAFELLRHNLTQKGWNVRLWSKPLFFMPAQNSIISK